MFSVQMSVYEQVKCHSRAFVKSDEFSSAVCVVTAITQQTDMALMEKYRMKDTHERYNLNGVHVNYLCG